MSDSHLYSPLYTKHIGQPLYYLARKYLCDSKLMGIHAAALPSSIAVGLAFGAMTGSVPQGIGAAVAHQLGVPPVILYFHRLRAQQRQNLSLEGIVRRK